ncbi:MAG: OmpA family protein [Spirochaetales bacterium]|nr:OmpA family protein [Leptospiraceae bacterium]MCP5481990.1 OmpA family protein [Spirochaetales bacterium]MCP5486471.1 OmpA family protein [Spirochaetales bacterium]
MLRTPARLFVFLLLPLGPGLVSGLQAQAGNLRVVVDREAFSPDGDGLADYVVISLAGAGEDLRSPADWSVDIQNADSTGVRLFRADRRIVRATPSLSNLYSPGPDDLQPLHLFERIIWDGRDDHGQPVADGTYQIQVRLRDRRTNQILSAVPSAVIVDRSDPELSLEPIAALLVLPPGQARTQSDRMELAQQAVSEVGTLYTARILDSRGQLLQEKQWDSVLPPRVFIYWDEFLRSDEPAAIYDTYTYQLVAIDPAGNTALLECADLIVSAFAPSLGIKAGTRFVSPNADGRNDRLNLEFARLDPAGAPIPGVISGERWELEVFEDDQITLAALEGGAGGPPAGFSWKPVRTDGTLLSDGVYHLRLGVYRSGGVSRSTLFPVVVDTIPPGVTISPDQLRFSPDGDGEEELLSIPVSFEDDSGIAAWHVRLYLSPRIAVADGTPAFDLMYRSFSGAGFAPRPLLWAGLSEDGQRASGLERFQLTYEVQDRAGNVRRGQAEDVNTDVLILATNDLAGELLAPLPLQSYFLNGQLTDSGRGALDRLLERLRRYDHYSVEVTAHTAIPGREEQNLELSEQHAWLAYRYLRDRGFPASRLSYRGYGETEPEQPGDTPFAHYRNRRLLVHLKPRPAGG